MEDGGCCCRYCDLYSVIWQRHLPQNLAGNTCQNSQVVTINYDEKGALEIAGHNGWPVSAQRNTQLLQTFLVDRRYIPPGDLCDRMMRAAIYHSLSRLLEMFALHFLISLLPCNKCSHALPTSQELGHGGKGKSTCILMTSLPPLSVETATLMDVSRRCALFLSVVNTCVSIEQVHFLCAAVRSRLDAPSSIMIGQILP